MAERTPSVVERLEAQIDARRLQIDSAQRAAATRLDALGAQLRAASRRRFKWLGARDAAPRGVYLWGGVGRGKTLMMDLFFATLEGHVEGAVRTHFYRFMRDVHVELGRIERREQPLKIVAQRFASRTRIICLDEFFVADIADAMILGTLLAALFERGVTLVTTSNVPPQELYKDGLQRQRFLPAIDLLQTHLDVVELDAGVDYRLRQLVKAPTYLDSTRLESATELAERFAALSGGGGSGPVDLVVEGRILHALDSGAGVAFFEFSALCEGPRGQNDYIELARLYHLMVIANIPIFDASTDNAARRFIMLIDELYDRGVKIVVSAAAPPARLYQGERLTFEFERAASRLMEMQSQEYLARKISDT